METITMLKFYRIKTLASISAESSSMEHRVTESFTMELSSNNTINLYRNNTLLLVTTFSPAGVVLDSSWEVALSEIAHFSSFNNVVGGKSDFFGPLKESGKKL